MQVDHSRRAALSHLWEIIEVETIPCNHKLHPSVTSATHDLNGAGYQAGLKRFRPTCTKLAAWSLTQFNRVLFLDVDTLVVEPMDDILYAFSNASFAACPDVFPPDNFNSGVLVSSCFFQRFVCSLVLILGVKVLNPSMETFYRLLEINKVVGSAEGGDQGVLNNGFCPQWNSVGADDPDCGRLPWIFNVQAAHYENYKTLRKMSGLREPTLIHFVSDGKPWRVMAMDYQKIPFSAENIAKLHAQREAHLLWRAAFFGGTVEEGIAPPSTSVLFLDSQQQIPVAPATGEFDFNFGGNTVDSKRPASEKNPTSIRKKKRSSDKKVKSQRKRRKKTQSSIN